MVYRIALIRHGESLWNLENIFTGWTDVDLSATGKKEAIQVIWDASRKVCRVTSVYWQALTARIS